MRAEGTFEVKATFEPPYDTVDGVQLARARFDKQFSGPLDATSRVHMLGARTPVAGSAGYVALERVAGSLDNRVGTFVLMHSGAMQGASQSLSVNVVPDSGTGQFVGISGQMTIEIVDGQHYYQFDYEFAAT